jgi:hypothetical protein
MESLKGTFCRFFIGPLILQTQSILWHRIGKAMRVANWERKGISLLDWLHRLDMLDRAPLQVLWWILRSEALLVVCSKVGGYLDHNEVVLLCSASYWHRLVIQFNTLHFICPFTHAWMDCLQSQSISFCLKLVAIRCSRFYIKSVLF